MRSNSGLAKKLLLLSSTVVLSGCYLGIKNRTTAAAPERHMGPYEDVIFYVNGMKARCLALPFYHDTTVVGKPKIDSLKVNYDSCEAVIK